MLSYNISYQVCGRDIVYQVDEDLDVHTVMYCNLVLCCIQFCCVQGAPFESELEYLAYGCQEDPLVQTAVLSFQQQTALQVSPPVTQAVRTVLPTAIFMMTVTIAIIVTGISNSNSDNSDSSSDNNRHVKLEKGSGCMKSHLLQTTILSVKRLIAFVSTVQHHLNRTGSNQ